MGTCVNGVKCLTSIYIYLFWLHEISIHSKYFLQLNEIMICIYFFYKQLSELINVYEFWKVRRVRTVIFTELWVEERQWMELSTSTVPQSWSTVLDSPVGYTTGLRMQDQLKSLLIWKLTYVSWVRLIQCSNQLMKKCYINLIFIYLYI